MRNWLTLSDARYTLVNLKVLRIESVVHGGSDSARRRKKIACRSAAKVQKASNTGVGVKGRNSDEQPDCRDLKVADDELFTNDASRLIASLRIEP